ncbi:MAG: 5-bromo-4-chloroindolyl phosphate hydrolysis family protein [Clostridia bacterium]|nr:5-bromo-4-chloroindolyl phosphate hydrolysis family protein [Clostridia bacterium]
MNAKKILKTLDYLPRWAWYLLSFFAAGPFGPLGVYLVFHVLKKMSKEQEEAEKTDAYARRTASAVHSRQDGYEDEAYTVVSDEEVMRRWQRTEESAARARHTQEPSIDENADVSDVIRAGYSAMRRIREANDIIKDEALSAQIDSIENSCSQILSILEQRPNLLAQLRTFLRYYLPTTLRLLEARAKLENSANTRKAREIRTRISEAVGVIDKAFLKQLEALDAYRFLDLESEMDVLRDMLKADGLINEDSEADDPFASVMGSH